MNGTVAVKFEDEKIKKILTNGLALGYNDRYGSVVELLSDLIEDDDSEIAQEVRAKLASRQEEDDLDDGSTFDEPFNWERPGSASKQATETSADVEVKRGGGNGFADIAGMDELKEMLRKRVILILQDKELAEKYKLTPPNGMLLYGPPGCGKSFFAEKFAEETGFNFILVKASDLGSIYIHGSQGKIADLFKKAEENAPHMIPFRTGLAGHTADQKHADDRRYDAGGLFCCQFFLQNEGRDQEDDDRVHVRAQGGNGDGRIVIRLKKQDPVEADHGAGEDQ